MKMSLSRHGSITVLSLMSMSLLMHQSRAIISAHSESGDKLQKRMNQEQEAWKLSAPTAMSESASEVKPKRGAGRRLKYPDLYDLIKTTPMGQGTTPAELTYDHRGDAIVARINDREVPIPIPSKTRPSSSRQSSLKEDGPGTPDVSYGPKALGRYAKLKLRAEEEGRLEEFMQANRERMAKRRSGINPEDRKSLSRYDYATRKMNIEALKAKDPIAGLQQEEAIKLRSREASQKHYHQNIEVQRQRHRLKWRAYSEALKGIHVYDDVFEDKALHEFDLNDPAPLDDDNIDTELDLNDPASFDDDTREDDEMQITRRGLTPEASSSSTPSARKVKHPELLPLVDKITRQPKDTKRIANSKMDIDPSTGKLVVQLRNVDDVIELEPDNVKRVIGPQKESSYQRRLREAAEEGPEALAALRQHFRNLNRAARQRQIDSGGAKRTEYYRYVNLARKKNLAILQSINPALAEERRRATREVANEAQRRYRKKRKEGIPTQRYRQYDEEGASTSAEGGKMRREFESMHLDNDDWTESSPSRDGTTLAWGQRGRRTQRLEVDDPAELQWGGSGSRRERDGRNTEWTFAGTEPVAEEQQDDQDAAMVKWRSIADPILSKSIPRYEQDDSFVSQLPYGHIPYSQMTKYQQKHYRAERRGELEKFKQKKKKWQMNYINRAIEKEKEIEAEESKQAIQKAVAHDQEDLTYYQVRRRRMKQKGLLDDFLERKRVIQSRSRSMRQMNSIERSGEGTTNASIPLVDEDASLETGLEASRGFNLNISASEEE